MNPQLIKYISEQLAAGYSKEALTQSLITQGWAPSAVETAFSSLGAVTTVAASSASTAGASTAFSVIIKVLLGVIAMGSVVGISAAAYLSYGFFFNHNALIKPFCSTLTSGVFGKWDDPQDGYNTCLCELDIIASGADHGKSARDIAVEVWNMTVNKSGSKGFVCDSSSNEVTRGFAKLLNMNQVFDLFANPRSPNQQPGGVAGNGSIVGQPFNLTTPVSQPVTSTGYSIPIPTMGGINSQNLPPGYVLIAPNNPGVDLSQFDNNQDANYRPLQVPLLSQNDPANGIMCQSACGPTAATMVAKFWGVNVSTMDLITAAGTTEDGTSLKDVENGLVKVGLKNVSDDLGTVQIIWNNWNSGSPALSDITTAVSNGEPVIVAVRGGWYGSGHTLVVTGVTSSSVYVNDPARSALQVIPKADFMASWKNGGYAYVIAKP